MSWPPCASAILCCWVKPSPWTQKAGVVVGRAPSLDQPVTFKSVDVLGSFYECVPLHFPLMYLSVFHLICVLLIFIQNVFCIFIMCLLLYYGHIKSVCSIVIIHLLNSFFGNHRSRCLIFEYTLIYLFVLNNLFIIRQ